MIITLENLCFSYEEAQILKDISFTIQEGKFVGVIGPNGGGKTTLLKLLMGFLKPDSGKMTIFGKSPVEARGEISYVPQTLRYDKQFPISVLELVLEGRLSHLSWYGKFSAEDKKAALESLEKVGMADYQHRAFGTLSGGQAQRVLIARSLASNPRLLLLDEPTASVDANAEAEIYQILKNLQGSMTILMVTHNLKAAVELVDHVICIQQTATILAPQQICEHFAFGLYHPPLIKIGTKETP